MKDLQLLHHALDDVHYVNDITGSVQVVHGPAQGTQSHFGVLLKRHGYCNNLDQAIVV